jgi:hypothetical protein
MSIDWHGHARKPEDVLVRPLGAEAVLLNLASESYFGLDEMGTRMWEALLGEASIEAAYRNLSEEFDVSPERLREDLSRLVDSLVDAGLLEIRRA